MTEGRRTAPLARDTMAYVLAGGRGSRLMELTDRRAKPAVPFGGKSRIIDFALSNALNSGIRRIGVATQYKAHSLIRHMQSGWNFFRPERNESFDILPASQRVSEDQWYAGTADAIYQNLDIIETHGIRYMVVLAGDHIYKMDYELMLQQHAESGADVTVGCLEVPRLEASGFGVMAVDSHDRINCAGMPPTRLQAAILARTLFHFSCRAARQWPTASPAPVCARTRNRSPIGAMWEQLTPIGKPILI
jgi:glucose-1-phosphate adenylyltransferase